jgi:hypothetical protein
MQALDPVPLIRAADGAGPDCAETVCILRHCIAFRESWRRHDLAGHGMAASQPRRAAAG